MSISCCSDWSRQPSCHRSLFTSTWNPHKKNEEGNGLQENKQYRNGLQENCNNLLSIGSFFSLVTSTSQSFRAASNLENTGRFDPVMRPTRYSPETRDPCHDVPSKIWWCVCMHALNLLHPARDLLQHCGVVQCSRAGTR